VTAPSAAAVAAKKRRRLIRFTGIDSRIGSVEI